MFQKPADNKEVEKAILLNHKKQKGIASGFYIKKYKSHGVNKYQ